MLIWIILKVFFVKCDSSWLFTLKWNHSFLKKDPESRSRVKNDKKSFTGKSEQLSFSTAFSKDFVFCSNIFTNFLGKYLNKELLERNL